MENKSLLDPRSDVNFRTHCALENDSKFKNKIHEGQVAMQKLFYASVICFLFMVFEFVGGYVSGSLAILTDASHMFSDVAGFLISYLSIYIA